MTGPWVMGISASQHNGAACLMRGDDLVVAISEERLTRVKRQGICGARPSSAFQYCLSSAGLAPNDLDMVVLCTQTSSRSAEHDVRENPQLAEFFRKKRVRFISHHFGHALSTLRWAGTGDAAVFVADGVGSPLEDLPENEQVLAGGARPGVSETVSMYVARQWKLEPLDKLFATTGGWLGPDTHGMPTYESLGGLYAAVSQHIFSDAMEAGKVMGLAAHAPAGIPADSFLRFQDGHVDFLDHVPRRFAKPNFLRRVTATHKILAASAQAALEEILLHLVRRLHARSRQRTLCLAGGVALNAIANERLLRESGFERIRIIPAADDGGTAIGAAVAGLMAHRWPMAARPIADDGLGHSYDDAAILAAADSVPGLRWSVPAGLAGTVAERVAGGQVCGWVQGGAEFGPRALGHRSILADPRRADMKHRLDTRIKLREGFRPYAPAVLHSDVARWFDIGPDHDSPFMLRIVRVRTDVMARIPAIVHVDGTARVQTVRQRNGVFFRLIRRFNALTGVPIVLNTSFNVRGEPIVETPEDALWSLVGTGLDFCVVGTKIFELDHTARPLLDRRILLRKGVACKSGHLRRRMALQRNILMELILNQINGRRTGRDIGKRVSAVSSVRLSNLQVLSLLARLGGLQLISFDR